MPRPICSIWWRAGCRRACARRSTLLVEVPEGDARSSLFRLKDYPKSANAAVIKGDIVRLRLIEELLGTGAGLDDLDPRIVRQLGQLGRRYDAGDLRRFAKPKRDALVACYLVEAPQDAARPDRRDERSVPDRDEPPVPQRRRESAARVCAAAPATDCTACSARSMRWWRPKARKPSPPSAMRWTHRP